MKKLTLFGAVVSLFLACNGGSSSTALTRVTTLSSGSECPAGGVTIAVGIDANKDGTLDDSEVKSTNNVCNGQSGTSGTNGTNGADGDAGVSATQPLIKTTAVPSGDTNCSSGGVKVEIGLDNGDGTNSIARNGILEPGEVKDTRYVCNGSAPYYPSSITPPTAPAGAFTISSKGGHGTARASGQSGRLEVRMIHGTLGGAVKMFATGAVDAAVVPPVVPMFMPGPRPMAVTVDTALRVYASPGIGIASNDPFFLATNGVWANVSGVAEQVTSVSVAAGVKLTLPQSRGGLSLYISHDFKNDGTITVTRTGNNSASLHIESSRFFGGAASSIITTGANDSGAGSTGGQGGAVEIFTYGMIDNRGAITTFGGNAETAGFGGAVHLDSDIGSIFNSGAIDTHAGTATATGTGGNGGSFTLGAVGNFSNSGQIDTRGSAGLGSPGTSGSINIDVGGSIRNTGAILASGASCTTAQCVGANGAGVMVVAHGGDLLWNAAITTNGGDGVLTGGNGGVVSLQVEAGALGGDGFYRQVGSNRVSGNISSNGGEGTSGGDGGEVVISLDPQNVPHGQEIELLGYTGIDLSNNGVVNGTGRSGGSVTISSASSILPGNIPAAGGAVVNYVNVIANGGSGGNAGGGGTFFLSTQSDYNISDAHIIAVNRGTLTLNGGVSSTLFPNSNSAEVRMFGLMAVDNTGAMTLNGGNSSGSIGGMIGGDIRLESYTGRVNNTAALTVNGGTSSDQGGSGGSIRMRAAVVSTDGTLTCNGGNGGVLGGRGGYLDVRSWASPSNVTSSYTVNGGSGGMAEKGEAFIDGAEVAP